MKNYTIANYEEDTKISRFVFNRYFKKYKVLEDDLIQAGVVALWGAREKYNYIYKYSTFAFEVSKNAMLMLLRKEIKFENLDNLDDYEFLIFEDSSFEQIELNSIVQDVLDLFIDKKYYCDVFKQKSKGFSGKEIAEFFNISKSYVSKILEDFCKEFLKIGK